MRTERFDSDFDIDEPQPAFKRFVIYRDDSKWGDRTPDQIEALHYAYWNCSRSSTRDAAVEDVWIADYAETAGGASEFVWDEAFDFERRSAGAGVHAARRGDRVGCRSLRSDDQRRGAVSAFTHCTGGTLTAGRRGWTVGTVPGSSRSDKVENN